MIAIVQRVSLRINLRWFVRACRRHSGVSVTQELLEPLIARVNSGLEYLKLLQAILDFVPGLRQRIAIFRTFCIRMFGEMVHYQLSVPVK